MTQRKKKLAHADRRARDRLIAVERSKGKDWDEIAERYSVSRRTAQRAAAEAAREAAEARLDDVDETVDERLRWARTAGLEIESDPREYRYRPDYYAGFLYDPDGIKLEIVHVPD